MSTLNVFILVDPTTLDASYFGNCDANGNVRVEVSTEPTTIRVFVVPLDGSVGSVTMPSLDLPSEPDWLTSDPQATGQSPAWHLVVSGGSATDPPAVYRPTVSNGTRSTTLPDPTIINVDPGQVLKGSLLPDADRKQQAASPAS